jgi:hypothetical protein
MGIDNFVDFKEVLPEISNMTMLVIMLAITTFSKKIRTWLEKKTNEKFENSINKSSLIRDHLAELRAIMGADRVLLFQLHNGQYYFSGEGADKLSLTHFVVDAGVAVPDRAGTRLQNIPISYWPETLKIMQTKGYFLEQASGFADPFNAQMFSVDGVFSVVCGPVKDRRGFWRGVIVVEYLNEVRKAPVPIASEYGQKIGDLLSL